MPYVYQRPPGHIIEGILSLKCPCCGNVGPASKMATRMRRAGTDGTVALWQKPAGRGRMSRAVRLSLDQLREFSRQGDVRATAAIGGLRYALTAVAWLDALLIGPSTAMQQWAQQAAQNVGPAVHPQARVVTDMAPPASAAMRVVDVGVSLTPRAKVVI